MGMKLAALANKQMDRKEFFQHVGVGAALVAGGGLIAKAVGLSLPSSTNTAVQSSAKTLSYGSNAYGR